MSTTTPNIPKMRPYQGDRTRSVAAKAKTRQRKAQRKAKSAR